MLDAKLAASKDAITVTVNSMTQEMEKLVGEVALKDAIIASLDAKLALKDAIIISMHDKLVSKDAIIASMHDKSKNATVDSMTQELEKLVVELTSKNDKLQASNEAIVERMTQEMMEKLDVKSSIKPDQLEGYNDWLNLQPSCKEVIRRYGTIDLDDCLTMMERSMKDDIIRGELPFKASFEVWVWDKDGNGFIVTELRHIFTTEDAVRKRMGFWFSFVEKLTDEGIMVRLIKVKGNFV